MADTAPPSEKAVAAEAPAPAVEAPAAVEAPVAAVVAPAGAAVSVNPVQLLQQYQAEATAASEGLRQRGLKLQETVQQQIASSSTIMDSLKRTVQEAVEDKSDVQTPPSVVVSTFLFSTVLTLTASLSFYLGANVFGGAVHLFLGGFAIAAAVLVGLPAYAYYSITGQKEVQGDYENRALLVAVALGSGVLLGAGFNSTYFYSEPLALLSPLTVALAFAYGAPALGNSRQTLLGAAIGGGLGLHIVLGLFTGSLSTSYLVLAVLYAAASYAVLVALFQNVKSEGVPTHLYMLGYLTAYFYVKALAFFLLGSATPYAPEAAPEK